MLANALSDLAGSRGAEREAARSWLKGDHGAFTVADVAGFLRIELDAIRAKARNAHDRRVFGPPGC
jgi:hypothetical protein